MYVGRNQALQNNFSTKKQLKHFELFPGLFIWTETVLVWWHVKYDKTCLIRQRVSEVVETSARYAQCPNLIQKFVYWFHEKFRCPDFVSSLMYMGLFFLMIGTDILDIVLGEWCLVLAFSPSQTSLLGLPGFVRVRRWYIWNLDYGSITCRKSRVWEYQLRMPLVMKTFQTFSLQMVND